MTTTVYAFDRDGTLDCSMGPVPLDAVIRIAQTDPTYAIGNQRLCDEADIPGVMDLREIAGNVDGDDGDHVVYPARAARLRMVQAAHPDADRYVHVDDIDVGAGSWDRWDYYTPRQFADEFRSAGDG